MQVMLWLILDSLCLHGINASLHVDGNEKRYILLKLLSVVDSLQTGITPPKKF